MKTSKFAAKAFKIDLARYAQAAQVPSNLSHGSPRRMSGLKGFGAFSAMNQGTVMRRCVEGSRILQDQDACAAPGDLQGRSCGGRQPAVAVYQSHAGYSGYGGHGAEVPDGVKYFILDSSVWQFLRPHQPSMCSGFSYGLC